MSSNNFIDEVSCSVSKVTALQIELHKDLDLISNGEREIGLLPRGINQIEKGTNCSLHFALKAMKEWTHTSTRSRFYNGL
jgi:hypothetical protein